MEYLIANKSRLTVEKLIEHFKDTYLNLTKALVMKHLSKFAKECEIIINDNGTIELYIDLLVKEKEDAEKKRI